MLIHRLRWWTSIGTTLGADREWTSAHLQSAVMNIHKQGAGMWWNNHELETKGHVTGLPWKLTRPKKTRAVATPRDRALNYYDVITARDPVFQVAVAEQVPYSRASYNTSQASDWSRRPSRPIRSLRYIVTCTRICRDQLTAEFCETLHDLIRYLLLPDTSTFKGSKAGCGPLGNITSYRVSTRRSCHTMWYLTVLITTN